MRQSTSRHLHSDGGPVSLPPGKTFQHACQDAQETLGEWKMPGQDLLPCVWKEVETLQELCGEMFASSGTETEAEEMEWLVAYVEEMEWTVGYLAVMVELIGQGALSQRSKEVAE